MHSISFKGVNNAGLNNAKGSNLESNASLDWFGQFFSHKMRKLSNINLCSIAFVNYVKKIITDKNHSAGIQNVYQIFNTKDITIPIEVFMLCDHPSQMTTNQLTEKVAIGQLNSGANANHMSAMDFTSFQFQLFKKIGQFFPNIQHLDVSECIMLKDSAESLLEHLESLKKIQHLKLAVVSAEAARASVVCFLNRRNGFSKIKVSPAHQ